MLKNKKSMDGLSEICERMKQRPCAVARISGSCEYPEIRGCVWFYKTEMGVLVAAEVSGLPEACGKCNSPFFGFHIHEGHCCPHPEHAGDMPPLLADCGYALQVFLTDKYCIDDIIGRIVIIHANLDDFTSQPSGNSGEMIACGEIRRFLCCR